MEVDEEGRFVIKQKLEQGIEQKKVEDDERSEAGDAEFERRRALTIQLATENLPEIDSKKLTAAKAEVEVLPNTSDSQKLAISNSMAQRLTIVQGPPGTGKTHTSVRILTHWVKTMGYKPLLATSECNVAVDNIAEGLVAKGINVVRIGRVEKVTPRLAQACLSTQVDEGRRRLRELGEESDDEDDEDEFAGDLGPEPEDWESDEHKNWQAHRQAKIRKSAWNRKKDSFMRNKVLEEAEVICCTTISSGGPALSSFSFHGILIDEVAQATETSCIVPIVTRGAKQLVLCGDHCQLPPSVQSQEAAGRGFSLSLYSRLVKAGVPYTFLDTQYRAHPMLMQFSATCIYGGKLLNGIEGSERIRPQGIPWRGLECPATFVECSFEEHMEGESKANEAEAKMVLDIIQSALRHGSLKASHIGLVCPYKGQVRTFWKLLKDKYLEFEPGDKPEELEVASVDNFQGREKELIVFSAVRCNEYGGVGFLKDWRRLNVMITRARRGLVVVGNAMTLCHNDHWRMWLEITEKQGGAAKGTVERALKAAENPQDHIIPAPAEFGQQNAAAAEKKGKDKGSKKGEGKSWSKTGDGKGKKGDGKDKGKKGDGKDKGKKGDGKDKGKKGDGKNNGSQEEDKSNSRSADDGWGAKRSWAQSRESGSWWESDQDSKKPKWSGGWN